MPLGSSRGRSPTRNCGTQLCSALCSRYRLRDAFEQALESGADERLALEIAELLEDPPDANAWFLVRFIPRQWM